MPQIIAGYLQQQDQVNEVINRLARSGFPKERISAFYVNPPGQHDLFPIGGDRDESPGAKESTEGLTTGIATGGVIGAAVGAATTPLTGPLGTIAGSAVGAHIGALVGSMSSMKERGEAEDDDDANTKPPRLSGMMVAVSLVDPSQEADAVRIMQAQGANQIERAQGTIADGDWVDFNPLKPPSLILRKVPADTP